MLSALKSEKGLYVKERDEVCFFDDTFHVQDNWQFILKGGVSECSVCKHKFKEYDFVSAGKRALSEETVLSGVDKVHWLCWVRKCKQDTDLRDDWEVVEADGGGGLVVNPTIDQFLEFFDEVEVTKAKGYSKLPPAFKALYNNSAVSSTTTEKTPKHLEGKVFILCGEFPIPIDDLVEQITIRGGKMSEAVTRSVDACILGADGVNQWNKKTGTSTKKYKDFKKKKDAVTFTYEEFERLKDSPSIWDLNNNKANEKRKEVVNTTKKKVVSKRKAAEKSSEETADDASPKGRVAKKRKTKKRN